VEDSKTLMIAMVMNNSLVG